jgi:hypothetical protein
LGIDEDYRPRACRRANAGLNRDVHLSPPTGVTPSLLVKLERLKLPTLIAQLSQARREQPTARPYRLLNVGTAAPTGLAPADQAVNGGDKGCRLEWFKEKFIRSATLRQVTRPVYPSGRTNLI